VIAPGFAVLQVNVQVPAGKPMELTLAPAPVVEAVQIVSASRQEQLRESLNTNVSVLSRRLLEESGSQTVAELLREVPGVLSRRGSETAAAGGEQIQGIDSRQVLVLMDGQPLLGGRGINAGPAMRRGGDQGTSRKGPGAAGAGPARPDRSPPDVVWRHRTRRRRLEGLEYTMSEQALMPDDRILQWVLASAR